jgi:hypothetical protein
MAAGAGRGQPAMAPARESVIVPNQPLAGGSRRNGATGGSTIA